MAVAKTESDTNWLAALEAERPPDLLSQTCTDAGNAERLIALWGSDLRYCHEMGKWLVWDAMRWAVDKTGQARKLAARSMFGFLTQAQDAHNDNAAKWAKNSLSARAIASLLRMAEPEIFVPAEQLDQHHDLLNFRNGTVNLRTGQLRPARREDFITKLVHYDYTPAAACPLWLAFLNEITAENEGLIAYLQRAVGYSVTGHTGEKAVFIPYGTGDNGKSTLLTTIRELVSEYSVLIDADTLMARPQQDNNTRADLADLRGARFAQTSETEEGQRLSQSKLKRITQGMGSIKAVRKYENPIEFLETHKLWMDTNRRPAIKDTEDQATFSRLHPIPFDVTIAPEKIDREFPSKLLTEAEGILAWIVQGAILWRESGLARPPEVDLARQQWRGEDDLLAHFLADQCITGENLRIRTSTFHGAFKSWSLQSGERISLSSAQLRRRLPFKGFPILNERHGDFYAGLALLAHPQGDREDS
jgi:putative DNA primase/helicase